MSGPGRTLAEGIFTTKMPSRSPYARGTGSAEGNTVMVPPFTTLAMLKRDWLAPGAESAILDRQNRLRPELLSDDPIDVQWRLRRREQLEANERRLEAYRIKRRAFNAVIDGTRAVRELRTIGMTIDEFVSRLPVEGDAP